MKFTVVIQEGGYRTAHIGQNVTAFLQGLADVRNQQRQRRIS